jgi:hypothetical protein
LNARPPTHDKREGAGFSRRVERKMTSKKQFRLAADQIKSVATGHGSCIATDRITVDGCRVGYMYREGADRPHDSGWCFMAGDESDDYIDNAENFEIYDVNTIANYDPDIVPLLDSPPGSAFERDADTGHFEQVPFAPE